MTIRLGHALFAPWVLQLRYRLAAHVPYDDRGDIDGLESWFNALSVAHDYDNQ